MARGGATADPAITNRVNVVWRPGASKAAKGRSRASAGATDVRLLGRPDFEVITLPAGSDPAQTAAALRRDPAVALAEPDYVSFPDSVPNDPHFGLQWGLAGTTGGIDAVGAWDTTIGSDSTVVAIIDTGYRITHPDLAQQAWSNPGEMDNGIDDDGNGIIDDLYGADLIGDDMDIPQRDGDPTDDIAQGGHGVHTAGITGAAGNNAVGISGVAQDVSLMPLRVCSYSEAYQRIGCPWSAQISAINYAGVKGARAANVSLGGTSYSDAVLAALAANPGTLFVISAGNDGLDNDSSPHYPCNYNPSTTSGIDNVICVAATDDTDSVAPFSDWGRASVDVAAPGVDIPSTYPIRGLYSEDFNSGTFEFAGWTRNPVPGFIRSTAAPLTSGGITSNSATQVPGSTRTATTPGSSIGYPAATTCSLSYWRQLSVDTGDVFSYSVVVAGDEVAQATPAATATGRYYLDFDVPAGAAQREVAVQFSYTRGAGTADTNGVWLDDVRIECFAPAGAEGPDAYAYLSGTSMAAPHVTGIVALLATYEPGATTTDLRTAIIGGVDLIPDLSPVTGSHPVASGGRVNARKALAGIDEIVAPDTEIATAPSGTVDTSTASVEFRRAITTAPATFECKLDSANYQACTSPWLLTGLADGSHTASVRAIDTSAKANADPTPATATWTVDTTAPDTLIDIAPTGVVASTAANITFHASRSGATFECRLDSEQYSACSSPKAHRELSEGSHTVYVRATVSSLTDPSPASATWTVDTMAPNTSIDSGPSGPVANTGASFTFSSPDPTATLACQLDSGDFAACTSPKSYTGLAQGSHTFAVRAQDPAGNADATPASTTWTIDSVAPDTVIDSAQTGTTASAWATITFHSPDPTATFRCRLDSGSYYACTSPATVTELGNGEHMFVVQAGDAAGNRDANPSAVRWTVDATPPDTAIDAAPSATIYPGDATATFHASESGATLRCSINDSPMTACTSPLYLGGLGVGTWALSVQAVDALGNADPTPAQASWTVVAPPAAQSPAPQPPAPQLPAAEPSPAAPPSAPGPVAGLNVAFPKKRTAVVSWSGPAGATGYQVRISQKNSTRKFGRWRTVSTPPAVLTGLKKKGKYLVQVVAVNSVGQSAPAQLRFRQAK